MPPNSRAHPPFASVELPDGRRLSYREYGDPQGTPVLNCHGGLVCGSDIAPAHDVASELGIRFISPDRPGIGFSSPDPGRNTGDWARDVAHLLATLEISRCAVYGWSMGAQYALGVAAAMPQVVTRVVIVAGSPELSTDVLPDLNEMDRTLISWARQRPNLTRALFATLGTAAQHAPSFMEWVGLQGLSEPDRQALEEFPPSEFMASMSHAMRQPDGMVEEYLVESRPWGFTPSQVSVPVRIWQGDDDEMVPRKWAEQLASDIPDAKLHTVADAGHFVAYGRWSEICAELLDA